MINRLTRIASLVLAFGFFISCSTTQPNLNSQASSQPLSESQLRDRISSVDEKLESDTQNAELYYQKGELLTQLAGKKSPPSERTALYDRAEQSLSRATDLYEGTPEEENEKAKGLLKITWSNEHNQGVQLLQTDTASAASNYELAAAHFKNATVIIPDSAVSYTMGAQAMYKNQQPEKAVQILENARGNVDPLPTELLEKLAFLYLETGQTKNAVAIYEEAESFSNQNLNLLHGLSNAYISAGEHLKAVELLQQLIEQKPENVIYGQSLAKEYYFLASEKLENVSSSLQDGKQLAQTSFSEADSLLNRARDRFSKTLNKNPQDQELKLSFARFYQNSASKYQQLLPYIDSENKEPLATHIKQHLSDSIPLLEQLAGQQPEKQVIWQNLYQAYTYLGMQEKAQNAKSNL